MVAADKRRDDGSLEAEKRRAALIPGVKKHAIAMGKHLSCQREDSCLITSSYQENLALLDAPALLGVRISDT